MTPAVATDIRRLVYTVRARHQGEREAFDIARGEFVCLIGSDPRTVGRFEAWGKATGIESAVADLSSYLETVARSTGLRDRSALFDEQGNERVPGGWVAPKDFVATLAELNQRLSRRVNAAENRQIMAANLAGYLLDLLSGMYSQQLPPIMPWLGVDLIELFKDNILANVRGWQVARFELVPSPALDESVPPGQRPTHQGKVVRRRIQLVYRHFVADPRVSVADLSAEYRDARKREGVSLEPKGSAASRDDEDQRADTKIVRDDLAEGRRLLELPVPFTQWSETFKKVP